MRTRTMVIILSVVFTALIGLLTYGIIDFNNWSKACIAAGGEIEERYEYTTMTVTNIYDGNGNITSVMVVPDEIYSYHCWVNHEEIEVVY